MTTNIYHNEKNENYDNLTAEELWNVEDASLTSILIEHTLDYCEERDTVLQLAVQKIRRGGTITITGTDLLEIVRTVSMRIIGVLKAQELLYSGKISTVTINHVIKQLQNLGLNITQKRVNHHYYSVVAMRPTLNKGDEDAN